MKIYLYLDSDDVDEISVVAELLVTDVNVWLKESQSIAVLVNAQDEPGTRSDWDLGLTIDTNKKAVLAKPLSFLYGLAKTYKQEFVVGIHDEGNASYENICYFGHEEGKPDVAEVACYLGLSK